jgi:large subunit ribosomal protein L36
MILTGEELFIAINTMHVRASIKKMCPKCQLVKRRGKLYITCVNPKHKQRQG